MMQKEEKEKSEIAQIHCLDKFVDVMTHNLVKGHARESPQLLSSESLLCSCQCKANIVKNAG